MAHLEFDAESVPVDERSFDPIPAGDYLCQVIESNVLDTKKGDGQYLKLTIQVLDGPFINRQVWDNLNIINPNEKAREIAQRNLASLCRAVGLMHVHDSQELHYKPFIASIGIEESAGFDPKNKVRKYKPREGMTATTAAPKPPSPPPRPQPPPPPPRNGGLKPWQKPAI
jgi:hypothetical protein